MEAIECLEPVSGSTPQQSDEGYVNLVRRLSVQSVRKHFDAYVDVPWDEYPIDTADPRWEEMVDEELRTTRWYQEQSPENRARLGLYLIASRMKIGWQFENVLQRGLLTFAESLPNRTPEFRYVHHEIIEESQHSLMFQELVDRTGFDLPVFPWWMRLGNRPVISSAGWLPEMFFLYVLSGEEPIDFYQRKILREHPEMHPLIRRICQIHVTEEARHVCFAHRYLQEHVPRLGKIALNALRVQAPVIFASSALLMLRPLPEVVRACGIPRDTVRDAYRRNPKHRQFVSDSLRRVRELCSELNILTPSIRPLWHAVGILGED